MTRFSALVSTIVIAMSMTAVAQSSTAEKQPSAQQTSGQQVSSQPPQTPAGEPYAAEKITADGVHAGATSGGFFHATVAALAINDAKVLASRINKSGDDYVVTFADGKFAQRVTAAEVQAVRTSGFDQSDDPWVAVLYRGYEMRVLWDVIHFSIGHLNFSPTIKVKMAETIDKSDWLVKAYERAIRAKVSPTGELDKQALRLAVRDELKSSDQTADAKKSAENMLMSMDMFNDVSKAVKENGELFGAYKAPGNITIPDRLMTALSGKAQGLDKPTLRVVTGTLKDVKDKKRAAVVSTADVPLAKLKSRPAGPLPWYAPLHAYTVVDASATTVTLRNPSADAAKATFKVPAATFPAVFTHITVQQ